VIINTFTPSFFLLTFSTEAISSSIRASLSLALTLYGASLSNKYALPSKISTIIEHKMAYRNDISAKESLESGRSPALPSPAISFPLLSKRAIPGTKSAVTNQSICFLSVLW